MDGQMERIQEFSQMLEERPIWERFPGGEDADTDPAELYRRYQESGGRGGSQRALYHTTNEQYGQFYRHGPRRIETPDRIPTAEAISRARKLLGGSEAADNNKARDPGASARARAAQLETDGNHGCLAMTPLGIRLGSGGESGPNKYMPLRGSAEADADAHRRRLTTGYAKSYMRQSHGPFWRNIQTVAPGAGLDPSGSTPGPRPDTQVLTIDRAPHYEPLPDLNMDTYAVETNSHRDDGLGYAPDQGVDKQYDGGQFDLEQLLSQVRPDYTDIRIPKTGEITVA